MLHCDEEMPAKDFLHCDEEMSYNKLVLPLITSESCLELLSHFLACASTMTS